MEVDDIEEDTVEIENHIGGLPSLEVGPILPLLFFPHSPLLLSENQHFLGYFNFV